MGSILKKLREDPLVLNVQELYVYPELAKKRNKRIWLRVILVFAICLIISLPIFLVNKDDQALLSFKSGNFSLSNSLVIGEPKHE